MTDIEDELRAAMHAAVDGAETSPDELLRMIGRRHRKHSALVASIVLLVALALAIPGALTLHGGVISAGSSAGTHHSTTRPKPLPTTLSGLPMRAGTDLRFLIATSQGAAWFSTTTRRSEPIAGLPAAQGGDYQFGRLDGGWLAWSSLDSSPCPVITCAGTPRQFYFIADGSLRATRIGAGYRGDGVGPSSRAGAVWLVTYPRPTASISGSAYAQLVSTAGLQLGPEYRLPADYLMDRGVGRYLLLADNMNQNLYVLWDPRTGRVVRHLDNVIAAGPEQIAWSAGCRTCRVQVLNVSTGSTVTTSIPGGEPANLNATMSDDGKLLAVQLPGRELAVWDTGSGRLTPIAGSALSAADWQGFDWQNGGHRLIVTAGPASEPGPVQAAFWQPGDKRLEVVNFRNPAEFSPIETGSAG